MERRTSFLRRWGVALLASTVVVAVLVWRFYPQSTAQATPAAAPSGAAGGKPAGPGGRDSRPVPVSALPARTGDIGIYLSAIGTVTPLNTVTVRSRVDGQLVKVFFREGQTVRAGERLAEIDPRPFEAALAQVEGQLERDRALLQNARVDLQRYGTLLEQDSIAQQQVDTQKALVRQYEGTLRVDEAAVQNARLQLSYCHIVAPIGGRLGLRLVDEGNMVHANDQNGLVVITQLQPATVIFAIPEDRVHEVVRRLHGGDELAVEAWDREQRNVLARGQLLTVDNQVDTATGTVKLKALFPNQDGRLFPNQFVNARLLLDTSKGATLIPAVAVQRGSQGPFVYVVRNDQTVAARPVKISTVQGDDAAVEEGVAAGEQVVTDGLDKLRDGAKVELQAPGGGPKRRGKP
jgi:multidrug efflux system membrane fusion protein